MYVAKTYTPLQPSSLPRHIYPLVIKATSSVQPWTKMHVQCTSRMHTDIHTRSSHCTTSASTFHCTTVYDYSDRITDQSQLIVKR